MPEYLDPSIANEGMSAEGFNADTWAPAVEEARIPSYKGIKSIQKYFPQYTGRPYQHKTFPCWLYHPNPKKKPVLVNDLRDAEGIVLKKAEAIAKDVYGCEYRPSTRDEMADGFPSHRWVYSGEWKAKPFEHHTTFDPAKPDTGKHVVHDKQQSSGVINPETVALILAAVRAEAQDTAHEVAAKRADPDWLEFQAFKAWKASDGGETVAVPANALSTPTAEKAIWLAEAERLGIDVDKRWGIERLKAEVDKAS